MKLFLANDTSRSSHAGCRAVMRSLKGCLSEIPSIEIAGTEHHDASSIDEDAFLKSDVLFVNGEGTIHHSGPRARFLLALIERAKLLGKRVILANALFQVYECEDASILRDLALLTVREPRSAAFARIYGGDPVVLLDSAADPAYLRHGRAIPGKLGVLKGGFHQKGLLYDPFSEVRGTSLTMRSGSFEDIVATLADADLYLTAQHHGVYAAALAGCPFVSSPSNSHKIESFIEWSGLPIPICMSLREIESAMGYAVRNRSLYLEFRDFVSSKSVLSAPLIAKALDLPTPRP
jgi:Polysaccharide pyruvyl transferase